MQVGAAIKRASDIINSVRKSVIDTEEVFKAVGFRLVAKNATRWNSQLNSLRSIVKALDIDPQIQNRLNATTQKHAKLSPLELKLLKEVIIILTPFQEATDDYQGDFETMGTAIPAYIDLVNKVTLTVESNGITSPNPISPLAGKVSHCKSLVDALKESLVKRMSFILHETVYVLGKLGKQYLHYE